MAKSIPIPYSDEPAVVYLSRVGSRPTLKNNLRCKGLFPFEAKGKKNHNFKSAMVCTYQIELFDVPRCKAVSVHTELGLGRGCSIQNLRTIQSSYCSVLWSSVNPNPATKRTTLNKQQAKYIYIRIHRCKLLKTLHHETDIQMTCHETPACRIVSQLPNITFTSCPKVFKRRREKDMQAKISCRYVFKITLFKSFRFH